MNIRSLLSAPLFLLLALASCTENEYKILDDGVVVNIREAASGGPQKVRLTVMSDHVIRVTSTPDKTFRNRNSLIVLPDAAKAAGVVLDNGDSIRKYMEENGNPGFVVKTPVYAIPTNAGTGSENTPMCVIHELSTDTKKVVGRACRARS